jgi:hypothetical protein
MTLKEFWRIAMLGFKAGTRDFYRPMKIPVLRYPPKKYESRKGKDMSQDSISKLSGFEQPSRAHDIRLSTTGAQGLSLSLLGWLLHLATTWFWNLKAVVSLEPSRFFAHTLQFAAWSMMTVGFLQLISALVVALYRWIRKHEA